MRVRRALRPWRSVVFVRAAACARRPSIRRVRRRRHRSVRAASASVAPVVMTSSTSAMRAPCTGRARRTRREHCGGVPPTAAPSAAARRRSAPSGAASGSPVPRATRTAISRAWLKPRSRWRAAASGRATMRSGRSRPHPTRERGAHGGGERGAGPLGERDPAAVLDALEQSIDRKRVGECGDGARRTAVGARGTRRMRRPPAEGSAQTGHAAATRGSASRAGAHSRSPSVRRDAELAALREQQTRDGRSARATPRAAPQSNDSAFVFDKNRTSLDTRRRL